MSFPSRLIDVRIFRASEEATNSPVFICVLLIQTNLPFFSVMANAERISPLRRGINHLFCCSGEP